MSYTEHQFISHDEYEEQARAFSRDLDKLEMRIEQQLDALKRMRAAPAVELHPSAITGLVTRIEGLENQYFELAIMVGKIGRTVEVLSASVERMAGIE